jgi:hypothetical protein
MATSTLGSGTLVLAGTTSGTTTVTATAVAGTTTLTLPAATDTLVGKATTDTLTNKTLTGAVMNGTLGATTPSTVAATTLTTSSTVTHNGGTANGVAYLDGSKVLTTGSALVFDGTNLGVGVTPSAWQSDFKAIQLSGLACWNVDGAVAGSATYFGNNVYRDSVDSRWEYIASGDNATQYLQSSGQHIWRTSASGTAGNAITFTQAMTLDASGNLGIGSTSPVSRLEIKDTTNNTALTVTSSFEASLQLVNGGGSEVSVINAGGSNILSLRTANNEKARIDSSGNLLVGQTTQSATSNGISLTPAGAGTNSPAAYVAGAGTVSTSAGIALYNTTASAYRFYVTYAGNINATNTTITAISDQRLKENIRDLDDGLATVMALKPRKFDWKTGKGKDIKNDRGFIAQEFETVFPDMIEDWLDPAPEGEEPYKAVRADLIPTLVKAIQEQQALITTLTARITALESA